jgi:uncharacterized cupin superfamily protein
MAKSRTLSLPALDPDTVPAVRGSGYPEPFRSAVAERTKRRIGNVVGLTHFGVNLVRLAAGAASAQRHWHRSEDEFIYILEGDPILVTDEGETTLHPGMCAGFRAGSGNAHHLINRTDRKVVYLEIGDRNPGDTVIYPDDDLGRALAPDGSRVFVHRDGRPY